MLRFPTGGSQRSSCGVASNCLNVLLKGGIFRTALINVVWYINKTRVDFSLNLNLQGKEMLKFQGCLQASYATAELAQKRTPGERCHV